MRKTLICLAPEQHEALVRISKDTLAPISALIRRAVEQFLERERTRELETV